MDGGAQTVPGVRRCEIAARLGNDVVCPSGGCALLTALGFDSAHPATERCAIDAIAERAGSEPLVVHTLEELRRELERAGPALSTARAARSRAGRHETALKRWPVRP
jgi:hypothetical protein